MLISVSGMVGSGKTTIARQLASRLRTSGKRSTVLRFQSLPCFTMLRSSLRPSERTTGTGGDSGDPAVRRGAGYTRKRLTPAVALVYLARIVAFRAYSRLFWRRDEAYVLNRYFYDLFAHYRLATPTERWCYAVMRRVMPVPDLAILVVAEPRVIAERRPQYSSEYLSQVGRAYGELGARFPELTEIRTDAGEAALRRVEELLDARLGSGSG